MRHIKRFPEPAILKEKQTEWQEKYNAKLDADPHARPDSSKYAHKEIKDTLYAMSYGKCFYCETKLSGGNREVDHFIEVAINHSKAYEWDNLYLSCSNCKLDELPGLWDVLRGKMSFVGPRPDVPGYADKLTGDDRDVLKLRPGITGPATLKYRLEDEMIAEWVREVKSEKLKVKSEGSQTVDCRRPQTRLDQTNELDGARCSFGSKSDKNLLENLPENIDKMSDQELAVWYNDNVIYPDKVRLNSYYYRHYSFVKDIQMILCTVLGRKMKYAGEEI